MRLFDGAGFAGFGSLHVDWKPSGARRRPLVPFVTFPSATLRAVSATSRCGAKGCCCSQCSWQGRRVIAEPRHWQGTVAALRRDTSRLSRCAMWECHDKTCFAGAGELRTGKAACSTVPGLGRRGGGIPLQPPSMTSVHPKDSICKSRTVHARSCCKIVCCQLVPAADRVSVQDGFANVASHLKHEPVRPALHEGCQPTCRMAFAADICRAFAHELQRLYARRVCEG